MTSAEEPVVLVTDGACLGNPGPGGWAALLLFRGKERLISGGEAHTTNNRMELKAVCEGLRALKRGCIVRTRLDSQYVMKAFTERWLDGWQRRGWVTADKKPVKNRDLWQELLEEVARHTIEWEWVKGHAGDIQNERVDEAARAEALRLQEELRGKS